MTKFEKFCERVMWMSLIIAVLWFPYLAANYSMI